MSLRFKTQLMGREGAVLVNCLALSLCRSLIIIISHAIEHLPDTDMAYKLQPAIDMSRGSRITAHIYLFLSLVLFHIMLAALSLSRSRSHMPAHALGMGGYGVESRVQVNISPFFASSTVSYSSSMVHFGLLAFTITYIKSMKNLIKQFPACRFF